MDASQIPDPFAIWRDFYNRAEQSWTDLVQKTIATPAYAETLGKSSQAMLNNLEAWRGFTERYLTEVWNIPTRNDLGRIGEVIVAIDAKADDLDDRADRLDEAVNRIEQRLAAIEGHLATLTREVSGQSRAPSEQLEARVAELEHRLDAVLGRAEQILDRLGSDESTGSRARGARTAR